MLKHAVPAAAAFAAALLLSACAASNPYRPLDNGIGYTEAAIAKDRYEIMFHGTPDQDELTAKKFAILRAAEVARREKFPYFRIEKAKTREKQEREVIRETETLADPYDPYPGRYWGKRVHRRTVTRTEKRPVAKITVALETEACGECLSADTTIAQAAEAGVFER